MAGNAAAGGPARARALLCALLLGAVPPPGGARAATSYPDHPVEIVVPYAPGGVADTAMRIVADALAKRLRQPFFIENRPGAGGILAAKAVAAANPDGGTLLMAGNNNAISAALFKALPFDIVADFAPVSTTSFFDLLIVTRAASPLASVHDIVQAARARPGMLNIGTINPGSTQNLAAELFRSKAGIAAAIVPFRTSPDMEAALLRGDVDVVFEYYAAMQGVIAAGKIVPLASTGAGRTAYLPDVPTVRESGIPDYEVTGWNGLAVPTGTPEAVVRVLNAAVNDVLPDPAVQARGRQLGMEMRAGTPAQMNARMRDDIAKWAAVIAGAGIARRD